MAGVYIHIPFCKQACSYCDFHFSTTLDTQQDVVDAMQKEILLRQSYLDSNPTTLYFGGGTPSVLTEDQLDVLMHAVRNTLNLAPGGEITLEANPDDLSTEKLNQLRRSGINRLSIGVQSFHGSTLRLLNRSHDAEASLTSFELARAAGFDNLSIDLMYAIPGQPLDEFRKNVKKILGLQPEHISAYALTIEPRTVLGTRASKGKFTPLPDDSAAEEMNLLIDLLEDSGYEHYEVSNFCKPGFRARHNSNYWRQVPYLGIGPSAHSFDGVSRQYNVANNHLYLKTLRKNEVPFTREVLSRADKINEYLLTTLRTKEGADLNHLRTTYDHALAEEHEGYLHELINRELAILTGETLVLTRRGLFLADKIASDLFEVTRKE